MIKLFITGRDKLVRSIDKPRNVMGLKLVEFTLILQNIYLTDTNNLFSILICSISES